MYTVWVTRGNVPRIEEGNTKIMTHPNEYFIRTANDLIRIPEYAQYFDAASIGLFFRRILIDAYRSGVNKLAFKSETGWATHVARRYDAGFITAYVEDEDIMFATDTGERSLQKYRKTLQDMGLIKYEVFGNGFIYELGRRVSITDAQGNHAKFDSQEFLYWDSFTAQIRDEEGQLNFRRKCVEFLVDSEKRKEHFLSSMQYINLKSAKNSAEANDEKPRETQVSKLTKKESILYTNVYNRTTSNEVSELESKPSEVVEFTDSLFEVSAKPKKSKAGLVKELLESKSHTETRILYHEALEMEAFGTKGNAMDALTGKLAQSRYSEKAPLYSLECSAHRPEVEKNPYLELVYKYSALQTDFSSRNVVPGRQPEWKVLSGKAKSIWEKFGKERVMWTLWYMVFKLDDRTQCKFMFEDITRLYVFIEQYSDVWDETVKYKRREELETRARAKQELEHSQTS